MDAVPTSDGGSTDDAHTLRASVALDGGGACIAQARRFATDFLSQAQDTFGVPVAARTSELTPLMVSELVTNACKYAPGPVLMDLQITGGFLEITVWDSDPVLPAARAADAQRVGQHGLEIVMAVAVGFEVQREVVGKRITARLPLTEPGPKAGAQAADSGRPPGAVPTRNGTQPT
ncbi:ATP-binding protein [Streptomyces sp. NPDC051976]|uniref:ATP-binding protein n=1 Tax=Streptomyces sp. NPDC051976 TaxID=3154947 RepID=UPI00343BBD45